MSLPVRDLLAPNALLFLWAVSPQTPEGFDVMCAWGFSFKTLAFVWSKATSSGKDVSNLGKWTMGNVENVWLGVHGPKPSSLRVRKDVKQLVRAERTVHSRKPTEVRDRIDRLVGPGRRKLELFARGAQPGWDQFGNEPTFTRAE
jgi:N6-adenosine-specific RNA methylase IME4